MITKIRTNSLNPSIRFTYKAFYFTIVSLCCGTVIEFHIFRLQNSKVLEKNCIQGVPANMYKWKSPELGLDPECFLHTVCTIFRSNANNSLLNVKSTWNKALKGIIRKLIDIHLLFLRLCSKCAFPFSPSSALPLESKDCK